jgi:O-antigen/teichoic acid export membrane protein
VTDRAASGRRRDDLRADAPPFETLGGEAAAATTGITVARGGVWNIAAKAIPQIYLIVVSIAAARFLGPDEFGRQSFIAFAAITTTMLLTAGLPHALARYVGYAVGRGERGAAHGLVVLTTRIEVAAAGLAAVVLAVVGLSGAEPQWAWFLAAAVAALGILQQLPNAVLVGVQRWREANLAGLVIGGAATVATVGVLWAGGGITGMFAVEAAGVAATLVWLGAFARRALRALRNGATSSLRPEMLRYAGLTSIGVLLAFVVWRRSELFFLARYSSDSEIGFYSVSFAAVTALILVPEAVGGVLHPAIATLFGAGEAERIRSGFGRALRLMLLLALPLTAAGAALGPTLLRLVYGADFEPAGTVLLVLVAPVPLISITTLGGVLLSALGRLRIPLLASGVATVVNLVLAFALIPRYDAVGAAVANGAAQLVSGLPVLVYASRIAGGVRWEPAAVVKVAAASCGGGAVAVGAVAVLGGLPGLLVGLAAGALVFIGLASALRALPAEDARWIDEVAGGRLGGLVGLLVRALASHERLPKP